MNGIDFEELKRAGDLKDHVKTMRHLDEVQTASAARIAGFQEMAKSVMLDRYQKRRSGYFRILIFLLVVSFLLMLAGTIVPAPFSGFLQNISASMLGAAITFSIIDFYWKRIEDRAEGKANLIKLMLDIVVAHQGAYMQLIEVKALFAERKFAEAGPKLDRWYELAKIASKKEQELTPELNLQDTINQRRLFNDPKI